MPGPTYRDDNWELQVSVERERYVVLLHLHTCGELAPAESWTDERIMRDLGFTRERAELVLGTLLSAGFLRRSAPGEALALTPEAIAYLNGGAGRRRSVRLRE
jgi:hypothetical protein